MEPECHLSLGISQISTSGPAGGLWALPLGLLCGGALQRSARPWPRTAGYALFGGMLLSYIMHSNLELFDPLVWSAR